jgi:hypothetical protein
MCPCLAGARWASTKAAGDCTASMRSRTSFRSARPHARRLHWAPALAAPLAVVHLALLARPPGADARAPAPALAALLPDLAEQARAAGAAEACGRRAAAKAAFLLGVLQRFCDGGPGAAAAGGPPEPRAGPGDRAAVWAALAPLCEPAGAAPFVPPGSGYVAPRHLCRPKRLVLVGGSRARSCSGRGATPAGCRVAPAREKAPAGTPCSCCRIAGHWHARMV